MRHSGVFNVSVLFSEPKIPQSTEEARNATQTSFSALQRAENSSMLTQQQYGAARRYVSVLFSEPKIPQYERNAHQYARVGGVSVLFSEPKIPQSRDARRQAQLKRGFSALQRAENSSIDAPLPLVTVPSGVSVLFSEPKIPQSASSCPLCSHISRVSVLFSEPKIPQLW